MMSRRASYLGLVGIVFTCWILAFGCSLDTTGFGESEDACTTDAHCDDNIVCTADSCSPSGTCVHTPVEDGLYPDGVQGNCKVFECKAGQQTEAAFDEDVDDGDECTVDKCSASGATHTVQSGAVCHKDGGIGVCQADGSCSVDCGGLDENGNEVGCPASDDACSISYCDKAIGKCVVDALDGVAKPGTSPSDCGGTYCVKGKSEDKFAVKGTACAGTTAAGNPAIVCDDAGKCVGCNDAQDCDPTSIGNSYCFTAMCVSTECSVMTKPDGTVLPAALQAPGDCKQKQCMSFKVIEVPLATDTEDDMNLCTIDTCNGPTPQHDPTALNSPCGADGSLFCDGAGKCQNCTVASQCGTDTDCHQFACNGGTCADIFPPADTPVSVAGQTAGDCVLQVCNGIGGIKPNPDNNDLPNDSNDCTLDQCSNGTPVFPPVGVGSVCNTNRICDAGGHCLGGPCAGQNDCPNGSFCADGVCCNTACTTQCEACTNTLKGTGLNGDCGTSAAGTDNNDTDCPGPKVCDGTLGAGACKLPVGQPCSVSGECLLGNCVDGYCCNNACAGTCQVCNAAGSQGQCTNIPFGQDPANECAGAINCNGTGACGNLFGNGTPCMMGTECQSGFCTDGVCCSATCGGTCQSCVLAGLVGTCTNIPVEQDPNSECTGNGGSDVCNGAGACGKAKGTTCAGAAECASGFCVDGVCCNLACGGTCQACNIAGSVGTCSNIASGQDPASECPGATNCNGNGNCALFSNGTACSIGMECQSGNCVDGVCCNSTCTGACRACNLAGSIGTCTNIANGQDPASECTGAQVCNGAGACVGGPLGATCAGGAECASTFCVDGVCCNNTCSTTCKACNLAGSIGTCSNIANGVDPANECPGVTNCNGAGACALLANGAACSMGTECQSTFCVDGVCCGTACGATCQACNLAGSVGTCSNIANGQDPANECANGACNGAGVCKLDNGQGCGAASACLSSNCVDGVCCNTGCGALCQACNVAGSVGTCSNVPGGTDPASECAGVTNCNGAGACGLLANGAVCTLAAECASGNCVDGVCCDGACGGTCQACNVAGSVGTCTSIPNGQDPANECANGACNGAGVCKLDNGQACGAGSACLSGNCIDTVCCDTTCTGACRACNVAGSVGTCSNIPNGQDPASECVGTTSCNGSGACALLAAGTACTLAAECASNFCVDGVCCLTACSGTCQSCNLGSPGACQNIMAGQDPASECPGVTTCNGSGACALLANGATCTLAAECSSNNCVDGVCCNNACGGTCQACNVAGSVGTCTSVPNGQDPANECANGACNGAGACKLDNGQGCGAGSACLSGNCIDTVCCDTTCTGACRACNVAGSVGTCSNIPNGQDPASECAGVTSCNGAGACALLANGAACTLAAECSTGSCVDGFCCDVACNGACEACSAALTGGANGTCAFVSVDTDPKNDCNGAQVCNIMGACVDGANGAACFGGNGADNTCVSNQCWDGFCCNSNCNGTCEACSAAKTGGTNGTCANIPNNQDPDNECANACNGSGACQP